MTSMDNGPASPGFGRPRPRSRGFSFNSNKSNGSQPKDKLTESPEEKRRRDSIWKNQSKANPNAAITEAQPGDAQMLEQTTIESLRSVQHRDVNGNIIVDPDLSNPTRPRLERPLDTIRSFEKAIDNGYKRRSSMMRNESYEQQNSAQSRRTSSYFGGYDNSPSNGRYSRQTSYNNNGGGGYYGNAESRPGSYVDGGPPRQRYMNQRMMSDNTGMRSNGYQQHAYQQSRDTEYTNGSDSTGQWANSTDPSSENSSLDRINATSKPQQNDPYGQQSGYGQQNGYGQQGGYGQQNTIPEDGAYYQQNMGGYGGAVQPPQAAVRRPIPLGSSGDAPPRSNLPSASRPEEKRKSRLSRMFSKKGKD